MKFTLKRSLVVPLIFLFCLALFSAFFSYFLSPFAILLMLLGTHAFLAIISSAEVLHLDENNTLHMRGLEIKKEDIAYIYEDGAIIIISTIKPLKTYRPFGTYCIFRYKIIFTRAYIKKDDDLWRFIKNMQVHQKNFLWTRLPYYINPF